MSKNARDVGLIQVKPTFLNWFRGGSGSQMGNPFQAITDVR